MFATVLDVSKAFDRVEYVKLFRVIVSKGIYPIVARFLVCPYTNQTIRVIFGACQGESITVANGVKQCGVMFPIPFVAYTDGIHSA